MMDNPLRLLILEDSQDDADLIVLRLRQEGFQIDWKRVETEGEFVNSLDPSLDVIVADYSLPQFSGLRALACLNERKLDIPFILYSGTMGEDIAVNAIKQGASDYVLKDRPARLGSAIRIAIQERQLRNEKAKAEQTTRRMGERIKILYQVSQEIARVSLDVEQVYSAIHHATQQLMAAEAFVISLYDKNDKEFEAVYLIDKGGRWPGTRSPVGSGLTDYVCTTGKSLLINDFSPDVEISPIHFGNTEHVRSVIAVPMSISGKIIGMLSTQSYHTDAYSIEDQSLLEMLSAHAAVAIQNAHLHSEIQKSEEQYRLITDNMTDTVWMINTDLKAEYISPSAVRQRGYSLDEVNSMPIDQQLTPDSFQKVSRALAERWTPLALSDPDLEISDTLELEYYRKDGSTYWSENKFSLIRDESGNPQKIIAVGRNITERKIAEQALRESEAKYRSLFENVPDGVYRISAEGKIIAANPALVKMLGFNRVEDFIDADIPLDRWVDAQLLKEWRVTLEGRGELINDEVRIKNIHNKEMVMLNNVRIHRDDQGNTLYFQGTLTDITSRIQRERELQALSQVGEALRSANTPPDIHSIFIDQIIDLVHAQSAILLSPDPYSDKIVVDKLKGIAEERDDIEININRSITGTVIQSGKLYQIDDISKDPEFSYQDVFPKPTSALCMPLSASGEVISALWVFRQEKFEPDEVRILSALADIVANALQRASLFEQITLQLRRMTSLQAIDHAITGNMDLNVTLNILLDQVISQLNIHAAGVLLFNSISQTLEFAAGKGFSTNELKKYRVKHGGGLASMASTRMEVMTCELNECSDYPFLADAGYITQIAIPLIAKGQVKGVLELFHREKLVTNPGWLIFFETLASQAAISIDNATLFADVQRANIELSLAYDATIEGWSRALDLRDQETEGHTQRVVQMTMDLANDLGITGKELMHIRRGALLHDIGKMAIPDSILLKPGSLTDEEWVIMRHHPVYAYQLLHPIPYLRQAIDIPYCHHEKWDGSGYPRHLKGSQIPMAARIFAVVDVYDAITSDRPYRPAQSKEVALEYIRNNVEIHFESQVVNAFFSLIAKGKF